MTTASQGLELVVRRAGRPRAAVPLGGDGATLSVTGQHTIYLEDLRSSRATSSTFYARARDVGRGKRPTESRSDIFFLEVTPFVDEFALAQSQAMAGGGGQSSRRPGAAAEGHHRRHLEARSRALAPAASQAAADESDAGPRARQRCASVPRRRRRRDGGCRVVAARARRPRRIGRAETRRSPGRARAMARAEQALDGRRSADRRCRPRWRRSTICCGRRAEAQRKEMHAAGRQPAAADQPRPAGSLDAVRPRAAAPAADQLRDAEDRGGEREDSQDETLERVRELARRQEALAAAAGRPRARSPAAR